VKLTAATLDAMIVGLELQIERLVSAIIHRPEFQALEARWAGLRLLVDSVPDEFIDGNAEDRDSVVVSIWNVTKDELREDLQYSESLQKSVFYGEVYQRTFNMAGGQPFGILIGDYSFSDHPDDIALLREIAAVCAAGFSPFVAAASPTMFHVERFEELYGLTTSDLREPRQSLLAKRFREPGYVDWNTLRQSPNSRFVVLALPRFLVRQPYDPGKFLGRRVVLSGDEQPHPFDERRALIAAGKLLWGNPAFALGQVVLRSFVSSGWLADIHGLPADPTRAGAVPRVVRDDFLVDQAGLFPKFVTEIMVTDALERELSQLGFLCLCDRHPNPCAFFGSSPTISRPEESDDVGAAVSQRLSSMLHYMLCACRFAHYIKRIGHDRVGSPGSIFDYQKVLHDFLVQFVLQDENAPAELKARQPLNDIHVHVAPVLDRPDEFHCEIMLKPHYELDAVEVHLETEFVGR
jgi:type VI secretion system ImpC/EvpB family protein